MTTWTFKQRNDPLEYLKAGCSSLALPDPNIVGILQAQVNGSTGATQYTRTIPASSDEIMLAGWLAFPFGVNTYGDIFDAGDWICRLNVSQANNQVVWTSVYICVVLDGAFVTVASKTDVSILLDSTGTKATTLTTTSPTDISAEPPWLYWLYGFTSLLVGVEQTFKYRSNKNLATPVVAKVAVPTTTFDFAGIAPAATVTGSAAVSVPTASLAAAGVAPATGHTIPAPTVSFSSVGVAPAAAGTGSRPVAVPTTSFASAGVDPSASMPGFAPMVSFSSAAFAPTATPQTLTRLVPLATFGAEAVAPAVQLDRTDEPRLSFRGVIQYGHAAATATTSAGALRSHVISAASQMHHVSSG